MHHCTTFQRLSLLFYITLHKLWTETAKSAIMKYILLIVRGHDAFIRKWSVKAVVRWVQVSTTSAVSQATKSYCGLRMKSCPRSCANLGYKIKRNWIPMTENPQCCMCLSVWVPVDRHSRSEAVHKAALWQVRVEISTDFGEVRGQRAEEQNICPRCQSAIVK